MQFDTEVPSNRPGWTTHPRRLRFNSYYDGRPVVEDGVFVFLEQGNERVRSESDGKSVRVWIDANGDRQMQHVFDLRPEARGLDRIGAVLLAGFDQTKLGKWWSGEDFTEPQPKGDPLTESDIKFAKGLKWAGVAGSAFAGYVAAEKTGGKRLLAMGLGGVSALAAGLGKAIEAGATENRNALVAREKRQCIKENKK